MNISVPAQTDEQYATIASNQCSWAAAEFVLHSRSLRSALLTKDMDKFRTIYKECLTKASTLRSGTVGCLYGENIDTPVLEETYKRKAEGSYFEILQHLSIIKNTDADFISVLHPDLAREFYTRKYQERSIESILSEVMGSTCMLVSRHGQSLAIIPFYNKYLICDSHLHEATICTKEEVIQHCFMDYGGYLHMTIMLVYPVS